MSRSRGVPKAVLAISLGLLATASVADADVLHVPGQYRTLRRAVRAARPGDTIELAAGRHSAKARIDVPGLTVRNAPGAMLTGGRLRVAADGVQFAGLHLVSVRLQVEGADFAMDGNFLEGGVRGLPAVEVRGSGAALRFNNVRYRGKGRSRSRELVVIEGDGAAVTGNEFGSGPSLFECVCADPPQGTTLAVTGDGAVVDQNFVEGGREESAALVLSGNLATVDGNGFTGGVQITGDDTSFTRNKFLQAPHGALIRGDRARAERNVVNSRNDGLSVQGGSAVVEFNEIATLGVGISIRGDDALVADNDLPGAQLAGVTVVGDRARLIRNESSNGTRLAFSVRGDRAVLDDNSASNPTVGIVVTGTGFEVTNNVVTATGSDPLPDPLQAAGYGRSRQDPADPVAQSSAVVSNHPGVVIDATGSDADGGVVTDNVVSHLAGEGISVHGNGVLVNGNRVTTLSPGALRGIVVEGDGNQVDDNVNSVFSGLGGLLITGDGIDVCRNRIDGRAEAGILLTGVGNRLLANTVSGAIRDGIRIEGSSNVVEGCTATGCGFAGLANLGQGSSIANSTFEGNEFSDVRNLGTFGAFDGNVYGVLREGAAADPGDFTPTQSPFGPNGFPTGGGFTDPSPFIDPSQFGF